jgi:hypothetical protein
MARQPQFERPDADIPTRDATAVKAAVKRLLPSDRAQLIAWLMLYYQDDGQTFSPQISKRRRRVAIDETAYWLMKIPAR